jgi:hypothetical protein
MIFGMSATSSMGTADSTTIGRAGIMVGHSVSRDGLKAFASMGTLRLAVGDSSMAEGFIVGSGVGADVRSMQILRIIKKERRHPRLSRNAEWGLLMSKLSMQL